MKVVGLPKGKFLGACLENSHMPLEIIELDFPESLTEKQVLVKNFSPQFVDLKSEKLMQRRDLIDSCHIFLGMRQFQKL